MMTKRIVKQTILNQPKVRIVLMVGVLLSLTLSSGATELTLEQALETAFTKSPDMRRSQLSLDASRHNLQAEQASLKSQFNLDLTPYTRMKSSQLDPSETRFYNVDTEESSALFSVNQPLKWTDATLRLTNNILWNKFHTGEEGYKNRLQLSFNQPLFTYNRTKLRFRSLELDLESSQLNYSIQKLRIESSVTQSFLSLYHLQRSVQIAEEEYANATESHEIILSKVEAGIAAKEELYQAELSKSSALSKVQSTQMNYENGQDDFKILLGIPLEQELELSVNIEKVVVTVDRKTAIEQGLANRMELRQNNIEIEKALQDLIRTQAENEFRADLELTYGLEGNNLRRFEDVFSDQKTTQSVGLRVSIPLFDWGRKRHQVEASNAQLETRHLNYEEKRRDIIVQIRKLHRDLQNQLTQIDIAEQNVKNAQLTYELNLERYKNGDLSSKDIGEFQTQLSTHQLGEVRALIDYKMALLNIKIETLWDFEKNRPVLTTNNYGDIK